MQVLYATSNPGKIQEVRSYLEVFNIPLISPKDIGVEIEVPETGATLEENALLKARAYHEQVPEYLVMADDTGVEIEALGGAPGIYVRRWRDKQTEMTDQEIIDYCIHQMADVPVGKRQAHFRTVIALKYPDGEEKLFSGALDGDIFEEPIELRMEGFPFESLFDIPDYGINLGELHQMPADLREERGFLTHREKAVREAAEYLGKRG